MWRWRRRIHSSWLLALGCGMFVVGVFLAQYMRVPWWWGFVGMVVCAVCLGLRAVWCLPLLAGAALCVGLGFGSAHSVSRQVYALYMGKTVTLSGRIKEDVSKSASGLTSVQLDSILVASEAHPGSVLVTTRAPTALKRGDTITVRGQARSGFGSFPMTVSSAEVLSVRHDSSDVGRIVRDWFADKVRVLLPEPQASLGIGFLTGQKSALPDDLSAALKIAGLTHIVVASGYNLTILVRLARKLFVRVSKYLSMVSSGLMITLFMAITGLSPSMTRAGLVSGLSLLAWYYGHAFHPFVLLPFAAAITIALQPSYAWGDLGWQLSFASFAGVMIVSPLLQSYFFGAKEPGVFRQILGETIAAHAVTMPIIALGFGTVSNVAVIANLLVVPLVPLAMLLTFVCGLWSIVGLGFGWLIAAPTTWLLGYMTNVATFVADLSWAQTTLSASGWVWVVYVALLAGACYWMWRGTRGSARPFAGNLAGELGK